MSFSLTLSLQSVVPVVIWNGAASKCWSDAETELDRCWLLFFFCRLDFHQQWMHYWKLRLAMWSHHSEIWRKKTRPYKLYTNFRRAGKKWLSHRRSVFEWGLISCFVVLGVVFNFDSLYVLSYKTSCWRKVFFLFLGLFSLQVPLDPRATSPQSVISRGQTAAPSLVWIVKW